MNFSTSTSFCKQRRTGENKKLETKQSSFRVKIKPTTKVITIWNNMTVMELAEAMGKDLDHVYEVMLYVRDSSKYDRPDICIDNPLVIQEILKKSGMRWRTEGAPHKQSSEKTFVDAVRRPPPNPEECKPRHPVVTIMGHVDHGKTTLLDSLRNSSIVDNEFGGITQHIGAFEVNLGNGEMITFLDTPGHAAFTTMRSRGAHITDIVVLVVAADDGVMEQTKESIRLANEAKVPIIVAINKVDKHGADVEETKKKLIAQGLLLEDVGGDIQAVPISALKSIGLDDLIDSINTQATLLDLKSDPSGLTEAAVVESRTDVHRGKLTTAVIQRGTLRKGSFLVAGTVWAKVRGMFNDQGKPIQTATPSTPVEIIGWKDLPSAGDEILEVESESRAKEIVEHRKLLKSKEKLKEDYMAIQQKTEEHLKDYKVKLEEKRRLGRRNFKKPSLRTKTEVIEDPNPKLPFILKGDVDGSVEAILDVLDSYSSEQCRLDLVHYGVGTVTENDIKLAEPFEAIVYAFNTKINPSVRQLARSKNVRIKEHNIIYRLIDDMKEEINQRLPTVEDEEVIGEANVLQPFVVTEGKKKVPVAGCRCVKGILKKNAMFRLIRGEDTVYQGQVASMKHLKNEVDSIKKDVECGIRLEDANIDVKPGDTLICYQLKEIPQVIDWDTGF